MQNRSVTWLRRPVSFLHLLQYDGLECPLTHLLLLSLNRQSQALLNILGHKVLICLSFKLSEGRQLLTLLQVWNLCRRKLRLFEFLLPREGALEDALGQISAQRLVFVTAHSWQGCFL